MRKIDNRNYRPRAEFIIVDTMAPLQQFLQRTNFFNTYGTEVARDAVEDYLDSIIDGVMEAVYHESCAITNLWDFARRLKETCDLCDESYRTASILARAVIELGETLNQQFKDLGAYENHYLGYYYSGRIGHADLILSKFTAEY